MLDKLKSAIRGDKEQQPTQKKKSIGGNIFGGLSQKQIQNRIDNAGKDGTSSLSTAKVGENAQEALKGFSITEPKKNVTLIPYANKLEEIAAFYSEGNINVAVEKLKMHINENKGNVEQPYWYMLLDSYEILNQKKDFENTAIVYAKSCNASPPSWIEKKPNTSSNMITGKNILILPEIFNNDFTIHFKDFLKSARKEKFCRINVSQCKFDRSSMTPLEKFYQLLVNLRKFKVNSILMGDNNLIDFCERIMNGEINDQEFANQEQFFSLLYLEVLQWKGKREEFEEKAIEYADKFFISAPGWEDSHVMIHQKDNEVIIEDQTTIDTTINEGNIQSIIDLISKDLNTNNNPTIDLSSVNYIDFYSLGILTQFIQEALNDEKFKDKNIIFKYPNEMMNVLFKMIGLSEFISIIPKIR